MSFDISKDEILFEISNFDKLGGSKNNACLKILIFEAAGENKQQLSL